jgi:hypothetical protein
MASTFSPLKIELIATGEQSGTWGITTNTNLGTAIEEAITGTADVSFSSADVTLTLTDTNASQTARNLRLNLTGTSGGARNLIVPAIEKLYLVNNGLADAVTVKNSTGTGIAIPSGKTMFVFNNGTNVVDATTYLSSLTLGSSLPTGSGGTGLTSFTSGGAVYATSTSALTTGTLPIASGGTNATATPTAGAITYGTGTAYAFSSAGTANQILVSGGTSVPTWSSASISSGVITASGFSGPLNGTVGSATPAAGTFTDVTLNGQGDVRFADSDSSNYVAFQGPATVASNVTWTLPSADGTSGQVLSTDGSGTLSWSTSSGGISTGKSIAMAMIFGF